MLAELTCDSVDWLLPVLFGIMIVSGIVWFVLMARLHRVLRTRHSEEYEKLGRPTLFLNNTIQNGLATIRFLLGGRFRQLRDPALLRLGAIMQVMFYFYAVIFASIVVIFLLCVPNHHRDR